VIAAPLPDNERARLRALQRYAILDTPSEQAFDGLTRLASQICGAPIALVSLVDEHRQWFKSRVGLAAPETARELAFCAHAILQDDIFEVPDALGDPRFADNPLVLGHPDIRFYAGAPLVTSDGFKLGTLCVIDRVPRNLSREQLAALRILGNQVISQLELRHTAAALARGLIDLEASRRSASGAIAEEPVWHDRDERERAFLAHATHDLRTPLNAILGFSQMLAEDVPVADDERREVAGQIARAAEYMLRLVTDILDVASLDSGAVHLTSQLHACDALVRPVLETIRPLAAASGNRLELTLLGPRATVFGDLTQIQKILFNLLSNACKYTHDGTIRLTVADEGERWVRLDVADTGVGLRDDQRRRLFRPFAQVHKPQVQSQQGTGLGLHITRGLCERMGGAITVHAAPGLGSTFVVWLPASAPASTLASTPQGTAIAVAEGDPDVRAALARSLGSDAPLVFIEGVAELLWTLVDRRWRAVVLDLTAPGAEEIELVRAVERMCRDNGVPLVLALPSAGPDGPPDLPAWRIDADPAELWRLIGPAAP